MLLTDLFIGLACVCIFLSVWAFVKKVQIPFHIFIAACGIFVAASGAAYIAEAHAVWRSSGEWITAVVKAGTATAAFITGVCLIRYCRLVSAFIESARLSEERKIELEKFAHEMESKVQIRTRELETIGSRLTRISQATDLGIWYCDLPFDVLNWSAQTKEHFWLPADAVVTVDTFYERIHPEDRERTRLAVAQSIESQKAYDIEYRTVNPLNPEEIKWIRAVGWAAYDIHKSPVSFDGITLDLTERKKKEAEKEHLQADLNDVLQRTTDGFFIVDSHWRMTYANPVTRNFFAIAGRSIIGRTMEELFPSPDRPKFMRHYEEVLRTGNPVRFEEIYDDHILQVHAYKTRGGSVAIFYRDVTEQVQANERLKESESRYATLTSAIPQLVWTCLPSGYCNYLSQQWEAYTGVRVEEQLGLQWLTKVVHPEDRKRVLDHWMGAVNELHAYDIEYRIRRYDGEYRWFQTRGTPVRNEAGHITYWVGTCTDIQSQKLLAHELNEAKLAAESANEAKTQFLANMSHEIRTPIGAITGFAEMLNNSGISDLDRQNFSTVIERNSKHLLRLIDDILDLSKVESGKIAFEDSEFSLLEFMKDLRSVFHVKATEKGVQLVFNILSLIPRDVSGDQLRLKQIISNIVGNALKFTNRGSVTIDVSYQNQVLTVAVTDTGVGIPEESKANLFRVFSQADPSLTRKFGGTGLGLVLSKKLANQFHGDLVLEKSEYGKGSRFVCTMVLPPASGTEMVDFSFEAESTTHLSQKKSNTEILEGVTLLLVEDSADNRMLICTYLKNTGAKILTAQNGVEGVEMALTFQPDVVFMDIQMPKMDGHEATRRLRAAGFLKPIIALTAHAMREERDKCFESGCSEYLTKPVHRSLLIEVIAGFTQQKKLAETV